MKLVKKGPQKKQKPRRRNRPGKNKSMQGVDLVLRQPNPMRANQAPDFNIRHTELFANVAVSIATAQANVEGAYQYHAYINPGVSEVFPWLSGISGHWDMWNARMLEVEYTPVAAATVNGSIVMAFDYDVEDEDNSTFDSLSAMKGAVLGRVSNGLKLRYTPVNTVLPNHKYFTGLMGNDMRLNCPCKLHVAAKSASTGQLGTLRISYAITLHNAQLPDHAVVTSALGLKTNGTAQSNAQPMGSMAKAVLQEKVVEVLNAAATPILGHEGAALAAQLVNMTSAAGVQLPNVVQSGTAMINTGNGFDGSESVALLSLFNQDPALRSYLYWDFMYPPGDPQPFDPQITVRNLIILQDRGVKSYWVTLYLKGHWTPVVEGTPPRVSLLTSSGTTVDNFRCGYAPGDWDWPAEGGTDTDIHASFTVNTTNRVACWVSPKIEGNGEFKKADIDVYGDVGFRVFPTFDPKALQPVF